jgi:hypothetical protein
MRIRPATVAATVVLGALSLIPNAALLADAGAAPSSPVVTAADPAAAAVARARDVLGQLEASQLDRKLLTGKFNDDLSPEALSLLYRLVAGEGAPLAFDVEGVAHNDGVTTYVLRVAFKAGAVNMNFGLDDASGKISSLYFRPVGAP